MSEKPAETNGAKIKPEVPDDVIVIKKYANRRLYNTATSSYVTLDYLSELVKTGHDFMVFDAKTGEDITRPVLTQIIFEQENKGQNLLPVQFLRQLIKFYGDSMQNYVPSYLEMSMDAFSRNQETFKRQMSETFGANPGYRMFEESVRKNMALYEQAMKMFTTSVPGMAGFSMGRPTAPGSEHDPKTSAPGHAPTQNTDEIDQLKHQVAVLKAKLAELEKQ